MFSNYINNKLLKKTQIINKQIIKLSDKINVFYEKFNNDDLLNKLNSVLDNFRSRELKKKRTTQRERNDRENERIESAVWVLSTLRLEKQSNKRENIF